MKRNMKQTTLCRPLVVLKNLMEAAAISTLTDSRRCFAIRSPRPTCPPHAHASHTKVDFLGGGMGGKTKRHRVKKSSFTIEGAPRVAGLAG